jgi:hypothetical protein
MILDMTELVRCQGLADLRSTTDRLLRASGYNGVSETEYDTVRRPGGRVLRTWVATWRGPTRYSATGEHPSDPDRAEVDALAALLRATHASVTVNPALATLDP